MKNPWWKDGIQFECQGSGRCCMSRGSYGYVYFTLEDRRRIAKHLRIHTAAFTRKYCDQTNGYYHLKELSGPCSFLKDKACTVYEGRPSQCRTWPFWPENMSSKAWTSDIQKNCPGVGKGRRYSANEIKALLKN